MNTDTKTIEVHNNKKKKVYYVHYMMERIGHLVGECFYLRNLYPLDKFDIDIVTYPLEEMPKLNKSVYEIVTRDMNVIHCNDKNLITDLISHTHTPSYEDNDAVYNLSFSDLYHPFNMQFRDLGKHNFTYSLNENDLQKGKELRDRLHIPIDAKIITIHVREPGYLPDLTYHSFRDADIYNYIPAIKYLINQGYYIVRIGDKSMKKLPIESEQLIDGPFCEQYTDFFDPYFISQSEFYIGMFSGPINIAQAFNIPTLVINAQISAFSCVYKHGLIAPKLIYSGKLNRLLTYFEILNSPIADFYYSDDFSKNDLQLIECTPDEIVAICKEMIDRINGSYMNLNESIQYKNITNKIHEQVDLLRMTNPTSKTSPLYLHLTNSEISTEFIKRHIDFLGHDFL